jgi:hypothetical protein
MWERAQVLLDRAPFFAVMRPFAGATLGAAAGGLYGTLCGGLHAAIRGEPRLFICWSLPLIVACAVSGLLMGICTAVDRAVCWQDWESAAKRQTSTDSPANGQVPRILATAAGFAQSSQRVAH